MFEIVNVSYCVVNFPSVFPGFKLAENTIFLIETWTNR